jgi:hypothetical protein
MSPHRQASLVPHKVGPLYFVLCDYGPSIGQAYAETDPEKADREMVLQMLSGGQFTNPRQVIEIDLEAGTARDVTVEMLAAAFA